jgi:hypothetical protein
MKSHLDAARLSYTEVDPARDRGCHLGIADLVCNELTRQRNP